MGHLDVHIRHGGSGGPDLSGLAAPAVIIGIAAAVAAIVTALMWWIIGAVAAVAALWLATAPRRRRRRDEVLAQWTGWREEIEERDRRRELERHQRRLEIARASAPVVQNIIDPAGIAAALGGRRQVPDLRVVRGEVER